MNANHRSNNDKLTVKNLPLSVSNQEIENLLKEKNVTLVSPIYRVSEESADLHLTYLPSSDHCRAPSPSPASRSPPSQHSPPSPSQQTDNMQEKEKSLVQSTDDSANHLTDQSLSHPTQQPENQPSAISLPANPPTTQSLSPAPAKPVPSASPAAALAMSRHNQRNPAMVRSFSTPRRSPSIPSTPKSIPKTPASGQQDIRVVMKRQEPSSSPDHA